MGEIAVSGRSASAQVKGLWKKLQRTNVRSVSSMVEKVLDGLAALEWGDLLKASTK